MQKFQPVQKLRQLDDYANFSNVEKNLIVTMNRFQSHNAAFYDVIRGIKI